MKRFFTVQNLKRVLAAVILLSFFLPLCQCTAKVPASPNVQPPAQVAPERFVPAETIKFEGWAELGLVAIFFWPLGTLLLSWRVQHHRLAALVLVGEIVLSTVSLSYLVQVISVWGQIRYGGVMALASYTAYLFASGFSLIRASSGRGSTLSV